MIFHFYTDHKRCQNEHTEISLHREQTSLVRRNTIKKKKNPRKTRVKRLRQNFCCLQPPVVITQPPISLNFDKAMRRSPWARQLTIACYNPGSGTKNNREHPSVSLNPTHSRGAQVIGKLAGLCISGKISNFQSFILWWSLLWHI